MNFRRTTPSFLLALIILSSVACGAQTSDARIGTPRAPRAENCELTVINGSDTSNFGKWEQVGVVRLSNAPAGTSPLDPTVRAMVRPRACSLGGEAISVMGSGDAAAGFSESAYAAYVVWAKKRDVSTAPEQF